MPQLCKEESYRLLEGLPELRAERVSNLENITVESDKPFQEMKTVFEVEGIELVL